MSVSIVIVHYQVEKQLIDCIRSIEKFSKNTEYEIIVVDNDEEKHIKSRLLRLFPSLVYISNQNKGFGQACNVGAARAKGKYLFFLNPDTLLSPHCLQNLLTYIERNNDTAIVAPILYHPNGKVMEKQGLGKLTPLSGLVALSFVNKLFPNNPISKKFWQNDFDTTKIRDVDTVPGSAFLIKKGVFENVNGFDENFFLFFEEMDLCKRIKEKGYKITMIPSAKVTHLWGESTKQRSDITKIFQQSRLYYFRKHFGYLSAWVVEVFTRFGKIQAFLIFTIFLSCFTFFYRLSDRMTFIGDQGWFYLSARDMLINGQIPLVGIPSSHPWLHQGAFWTYFLSFALLAGNFHPVAGGVLAIIFGVLTVIAIYYLGEKMFHWKIGIIAAALYATSPLAILHARMPYHTNPIPFFSILYFYFLFKWINGNAVFFPLSILTLAILYNFEIATIVFVFPLLSILFFGIWKKKNYTRKLMTVKNVMLSVTAFIVPMFPMLLYDVTHGFPQTIRVLMWMGYRILVLFGYPPLHPEIAGASLQEFFIFTTSLLTKLLFAKNSVVAMGLLLISIIYFGNILFDEFKKRKVGKNNLIIALWLLFGFGGYLANRVTSEAYLPMIFPVLFLLLSLFIFYLYSKRKIIGMTLLVALIVFNLASYHQNINRAITLTERMTITDEILKKVGDHPYLLKGSGMGSQFSSYTMNYEYLLWWKGHPPSNDAEILVTVSDRENKAEYTINRKDELR